MEVNSIDDGDLYRFALEIEKIGNNALRMVREENKRRGIPLVYSVDNKIYYELSDGTVTTRSPFI